MSKRLEKDFVDKVLIPTLKESFPTSWWLKVPTVSIRGIPDVIGCVNGIFVALEGKRAGAKADPSREKLQAYVCEQIRKAGGVAFDRVDETNYLDIIQKMK